MATESDDSELDVNLREGTDDPDLAADQPRRSGLQGSSYEALDRSDDLVSDVQDSLDENLPWDPPDEPVEVPTRAESRGVSQQETD